MCQFPRSLDLLTPHEGYLELKEDLPLTKISFGEYVSFIFNGYVILTLLL